MTLSLTTVYNISQFGHRIHNRHARKITKGRSVGEIDRARKYSNNSARRSSQQFGRRVACEDKNRNAGLSAVSEYIAYEVVRNAVNELCYYI